MPQGTTAPFTVTSGTGTWNGAGTTGTINASNRAVLTWGTTAEVDTTTVTNFNIGAGETFNFVLPSGGAVLNRVSAGTNTTHTAFSGLGAAAAVINGTLLSNGAVFVLANGNIIVGTGAQISTASGLTLSTLSEDNFNFTAQGNLALTGASQGNIYLGTGAGVASTVGNLTAAAGAITPNNLNVSGDLILNQTGSGTGLALTTASPTTVGGNFTATTNNGAITQGTGALSVPTGATTLRSGTGSITLGVATNDFNTLSVNTTGSTAGVTIADANIIMLGNSTVGQDLTVTAGGRINTTAIETSGTLAIGGNATFTSTATNNSGINIGHNSTIGGTVNASTAGGVITINTTGSLTTGAINSRVSTGLGALVTGVTTAITVNTVGIIPLAGGGTGYTSAPTVTISAPDVVGGTQATANATIDTTTGVVTGITIINPGSGYTVVPTVTLDNTGTGFTATATLDPAVLAGPVTSIATLTPSATGVYATAPSVSFAAPTGAGGVTATGTAVFNETTGQVTGITITNPGAGYTAAPTVTLPTAAGAVIGRNINITTSGNLTVSGAIATSNNATTPGVTLTGGRVEFASTGSVNNQGTVTVNSTAGDVVLGTISGNRVISRAIGGSISQLAATTLTASHTTGTSNFTAANGTITLDGANPFANGHTVQFTSANAVSFNSTNNYVVGTTNVTGNVTLTAGNNRNITLGTGEGSAGQNITVGGNLTATATGTGNITDGNFSAFNIFGGLNLTTASGNVVLDAASANGALAPLVQFGQVKVTTTTGSANISETTTLNLGDITAANLDATSVAGNIINSGNINVGTGTANFRSTGASTSVITNGTNTIGTANFIGSGGALTVGSAGVTLGATTNVTSGDDLLLTSTNGGPIILGGAILGGHLTVNSSGTIATAASSVTTVGGNLSLIAANTGASSIDQGAGGRVVVTGVTNVASSGGVDLDQGNDFIGGVVLNQPGSTGAVQVFDINNLTISGMAGGAVTALAGHEAAGVSVAAPWNIVLGNLNVASLTATASNAGGGNSGTVTQASGTSLHSEGTFRAVTRNANIVLTNSGNSAGRVEFFTNGATGNGSGTITYTEDGTIRVGNIATNSTVTLTSRFGSIIEDTNANVGLNLRSTINLTALNGSILLGNTTQTSFSTTPTGNASPTINANAPGGSVALVSGNNINLGTINANSLTVTAGNNITQSGTLSVFGAASFTSSATDDTRSITLTNNANNFGPLSFTVGNNTSTITVNENSTLNLRRVTMLGGGNSTFTATSANGGIIDTGLGGVRLGGNATQSGSGMVTLSAVNGNIIIDDPTSDIATTSGIVFNSGDVTLSVLGSVGSTLTLGATGLPSLATGNLTVSSALGNINSAGAFIAGGTASFSAPNGSILISQPGTGFGNLRFIGQQVSISEAGNMDILTGSASFGPANLVSGGSITIVPVGGLVTFGSTVNMTATGNIILPDLLQAAGQLRVVHTGTADLGALSVTGDLGNITPIDGGTGPYIAPQP